MTDSMMPQQVQAQVKHLTLANMLISWVSPLLMEASIDHHPFSPNIPLCASQQFGHTGMNRMPMTQHHSPVEPFILSHQGTE